MKVTKKRLLELDLPYTAIEDKIVSQGRWSIHHEIIFEMDGRHYLTDYSVGATERQDEGPWECFDNEDEIEIIPVKKVQKLAEVWECEE